MQPRPSSIFKYSLMRIVAAMFVFELLVIGLAFFFLMLPVLQNHAKNFATQIVNPLPSPQKKFTLQTKQPRDGGSSWLPFNLLLARDLQQLSGNPTEVRWIANQPNQYWLPLGATNTQYLVFNHHDVVGTNLLEVFFAWLILALIGGLIIATWLARGFANPIVQLRQRVHEHTNTTAYGVLTKTGIIELDELQTEFVSQTNKLALAIDDRTTLLMGLSHELGSPVARLTMALELYAQKIAPDKRNDMQLDLDEMRRIIEQFLFAAHCLCPLGEQQHSLTELMAKLQHHYAGNIHIQIAIPEVEIEHTINTTALERILINLIDNAQNHAADGVIAVQAKQYPEKLVLTVLDSGPGIAEADIARLFHAFEKRSASPGAGLGLALSRLMAEQNGWALALKNRAEGGLEASVLVPLKLTKNIQII